MSSTHSQRRVSSSDQVEDLEQEPLRGVRFLG